MLFPSPRWDWSSCRVAEPVRERRARERARGARRRASPQQEELGTGFPTCRRRGPLPRRPSHRPHGVQENRALPSSPDPTHPTALESAGATMEYGPALLAPRAMLRQRRPQRRSGSSRARLSRRQPARWRARPTCRPAPERRRPHLPRWHGADLGAPRVVVHARRLHAPRRSDALPHAPQPRRRPSSGWAGLRCPPGLLDAGVVAVTPRHFDRLGVRSAHVHGTLVLVLTHGSSSAQRSDRFCTRVTAN